MRRFLPQLLVLAIAAPAFAGPPYVTDDPEPTDAHHFEIYYFGAGTRTREGSEGAAGVDFNYGGAPNLQLTMTLPAAWSDPHVGSSAVNLGSVELAAKYKFLHQDQFAFDVAVFPRVVLPAGSAEVGERHASLLLPIWVQHSWKTWTTFGGGGCTLNHGGGSQNFCEGGWALTHQVTDKLQLGAEVYAEGADVRGGKPSAGLSLGAIYDLNENFHLLASAGPGIEHAAETNRFSWYVSFETTF